MAENNQGILETISQYYWDIANRRKIVAAYRASGFYNEEEMKEYERGIMGDFYYWMDKKADDLTLEEARDAVKDLRKIVAEKITDKGTLRNLWDKSADEMTEDELKEAVKEYRQRITDHNIATENFNYVSHAPAKMASSMRLKYLTEAMYQMCHDTENDLFNAKEMKIWAKETIYHCEIMENC